MAANRSTDADPALQADVRARGPLLILTGVLMAAILGVAIWASGMLYRPGPPAISQPAYELADHRTSDRALTPTAPATEAR